MSGYIRREVAEDAARAKNKWPRAVGTIYRGGGGNRGGWRSDRDGRDRPRYDVREMFRNVSSAVRAQLKADSVAQYSVTDSDIADAMTRRIRKYAPDANSITDFCACVGGNAASFAREFDVVNAIEIDPRRAEYLQHNLTVMGIEKVNVITGDALAEVPKLKQDVLYGDLPWMSAKTDTESDYRKVDRLDLFLGDMALKDVCSLFAPHCRLLALKVPKNFALAKFIHDTFDEYRLLDIVTHWNSMNLVLLEPKTT